MSGDDLVTDLSQMWDLATGSLPTMASEFAAASVSLDGVRSTAINAMGINHGDWSNLCFDLQKALAQTSQNLYDCGTVLAKASEDFANKDGVHADWIDRNKERLDNGTAVPQPKNPVQPKMPTKNDPGSDPANPTIGTPE